MAIALSTFCCLPSLIVSAQSEAPCTPVAYLFRHAEETGTVPRNIDTDTLKPEGDRHALLYVDMIRNIQSASNFCPVRDVFAMARKNAPNAANPNGIGTTNPFFTGKPFTNAAVLDEECAANLRLGCMGFDEMFPFDVYSPITSTNPNVTERVGVQQTDDILYEYLPYSATSDDLREIVKDTILNGRSVAFFWSSQGMDAIATVLGSPIPAYANNKLPALSTDYKAPRNSVFVFTNYNPNDRSNNYRDPSHPAMVSGKFETISIAKTDTLATTTGQFLQCFNYIPCNSTQDKCFDIKFPKTELSTYYCKYGEDLSNYKFLASNFRRLKGAICDVNKLCTDSKKNCAGAVPLSTYKVNPGDYAGYGVQDGKQCF